VRYEWLMTKCLPNAYQGVKGLRASCIPPQLIFIRVWISAARGPIVCGRPFSLHTYKLSLHRTHMAAMGAQHPLLGDCWATMDGLKLYLQQAGNLIMQGRFYHGWTQDHCVTSIFCFCPDGSIPIAFDNFPG
jgi:hypothetical protein